MKTRNSYDESLKELQGSSSENTNHVPTIYTDHNCPVHRINTNICIPKLLKLQIHAAPQRRKILLKPFRSLLKPPTIAFQFNNDFQTLKSATLHEKIPATPWPIGIMRTACLIKLISLVKLMSFYGLINSLAFQD